jgi:hypothetical protein
MVLNLLEVHKLKYKLKPIMVIESNRYNKFMVLNNNIFPLNQLIIMYKYYIKNIIKREFKINQ